MPYESGELIAEKYRIIAYLGKTELGDSYRVIRNDQIVERLLKVLATGDEGVSNAKFSAARSRYKLEAQLSAQLNSPVPNPFLVQVFDCVESDTSVMLEMEYTEGGSLLDLLLSNKNKSIRLEKEKAIKIAMEVSTGLTRLHDLDIVHRNLIPANILFDQYNQAKVAGYGQAQISSGPSLRSPFSNPSQHPGTPGYMSPEQRQSSERLTPSSDIYALGLILFEMLTGHNYSNFRPRTRLSDLMPGVKASLNDLVARMLSEFPNDRPRDGRVAANELHREFIAEELAQREALAKKRRELDEWERLKKEELSRQSADIHAVQIIQPITKSEENLPLTTSPIKNEIEHTQEIEDISEIDNNAVAQITSDKPTKEVQPQQVESKLSEIGKTSKPKVVRLSELKRFWWIAVPLVIALLLIPIFTNRQDKPDATVSTAESAIVLPTLISTPTIHALPSESATQPTMDLVQPARIATEIVQSITQAPGLTMANTVITPRKESTIIPIPTNVMRDASFENKEGWELKVGDYHIQGQFSTSWASQGKQSYQISLVGDKKFEYCFTPGMRTTVNQSIDLTNVKAILFDMNIQPAVYLGTSHGDNSKPRAVVFVDGDPVFTIPENSFGDLPEQRIALDGKYSGRHDVKLGLMVMSKLCVKSVMDNESFLVYFDNIRLEY